MCVLPLLEVVMSALLSTVELNNMIEQCSLDRLGRMNARSEYLGSRWRRGRNGQLVVMCIASVTNRCRHQVLAKKRFSPLCHRTHTRLPLAKHESNEQCDA